MARTRTEKRIEIVDADVYPEQEVEDKPDPENAGQSGDTQGLSNTAQADSQSVEELVEEGQFFEAAVISGVENAPPADQAEVTPKQVREDDVPPEYIDQDQERPYSP